MATIRKRGSSYQIRASSGYKGNGTQNTRSITWTPSPGMTQRQIEKQLTKISVEFETKVMHGQFMDSNMKFSEYAEIWLNRGLPSGERPLAPKTFNRYKDLLTRINEALGAIKLINLNPQHIRDFLSNLRESNIRLDCKYNSLGTLAMYLKAHGITGKELSISSGLGIQTVYSACRGNNVTYETACKISTSLNSSINSLFKKVEVNDGKLSDKSILHYYRLITSILNSAVKDDGAIDSNPATKVRPPKVKHDEVIFLSEIQAREFVTLLEGEPIVFKTMMLILIYSGMRRSELCGLEWRDIDFCNNVITICRTSQYTPDRGIYVGSTKNSSSERTVKISDALKGILLNYKKWQDDYKLEIGDKWSEHNRIYISWDGNPGHPDTLTHQIEHFISKTSLPKIHLHSLRHTNATLMIAAGEDILTISHQLGHAQPSTTTNIYGHALENAKAKAAKAVENLLNPIDK